jgi:hypothetical protein
MNHASSAAISDQLSLGSVPDSIEVGKQRFEVAALCMVVGIQRRHLFPIGHNLSGNAFQQTFPFGQQVDRLLGPLGILNCRANEVDFFGFGCSNLSFDCGRVQCGCL